jgi:hypothetical protein
MIASRYISYEDSPRRKFQSQLEAVDKAMPFARYRLGYNSPQIVQIIGPQVVANPNMKNAARQIMAVPVDSVFSGCCLSREKWPAEAKQRNIMNIQVLPNIKDFRLPYASTK